MSSRVVASLLFVALELRQSNRIAIANVETQLRATDRELSIRIAENPDLAALINKLGVDAELSPTEERQATNFAQAAFAGLSQANQAYENGLLTEYSVGIYQTQIAEYLEATPGIGKYWANTVRFYGLENTDSPLWSAMANELKERGFLSE